jgi:hypothetical protein
MIPVILSFLLLAAFFWGRNLRFTDLNRHIRVMTMVLIGDLALVGGLVVVRDALSKVHTDMKWSLMIHVPIAVLTVVLYLLLTFFAVGTYMGKPWRIWIRRFDRFLVPARVLTSLTSLLVYFF